MTNFEARVKKYWTDGAIESVKRFLEFGEGMTVRRLLAIKRQSKRVKNELHF